MSEDSEVWLFNLIHIELGSVSSGWMIVQFSALFSPSSHYCVFFCIAFPFLILDCDDFLRSFCCEILDNPISLFAVVSQ